MIYDIIIIGGGCAGVSAAIYSESRGLTTLIIEQEEHLGGLVRKISAITHFLGARNKESGIAFADHMAEQLHDTGIEICQDEIQNIKRYGEAKKLIGAKQEYLGRALIIAAGTTQKELDIHSASGRTDHVISHCAHQDKDKYDTQNLFVVGGSDGAAKEALFLADTAKQVTMIVVEKQLACIASFRKEIERRNNIRVISDSRITKISAAEQLESIEVTNNSTGETSVFHAPNGGIFVYIGSTPNTAWCSGLKLNSGYLVTDSNMQTNVPFVYAVGDIRDKAIRQISTAVSDGTTAAIHAATQLIRLK